MVPGPLGGGADPAPGTAACDLPARPGQPVKPASCCCTRWREPPAGGSRRALAQERQQTPGQDVGDLLGDPVPAGQHAAGDVLGVGLRLVGHDLADGGGAAERQDRGGQRGGAVADGVGDVLVERLEVLQ